MSHLLTLAMLCWTAGVAVAAPDNVVVVTDCENLNGWPQGVKLTDDRHEGQHAVLYEAPGKLSSCNYNFGNVPVDIAQVERLTFWYKVEGEGLKSLMVKVVAYPLADGMQATWPIAEGNAGLGVWHLASVDFQHPPMIWGEKPDKTARLLMFRVDAAAPVKLYLDDIRFAPLMLKLSVGAPRCQPDAKGLRFEFPVSVENVTGTDLAVEISAEGAKSTRQVTARQTDKHTLELRLTKDWLNTHPPLSGQTATIAVEGVGIPHSRQEVTVTMTKPLALPPHPRLLLTAQQVSAIKQKMEKFDWAQAAFDSMRKDADGWLTREIVLPPRGGQWWHWYACREHGARLKTQSPTEHVCPVDGKVYTGYPYDDVVLSADHDRLARAVQRCGLVYQLTGDKRYAAKAREILLAYADRYLSYPLHNIRGKPELGGGRVGPQTLDESVWLIPMAQGADMVWEVLSADDIAKLRDQLFYPAAVDVIQKHRMGIHNIQCWKNSAVGLTGLLFDDAALAADAFAGPTGYREQMRQGVSADGEWYEGAWGYHFYTLSALWPLTEAAEHCGLEPYGPELKRMYDAPLAMAMPNLQLPAFNDSGTVNLAGSAHLYETAYARYHNPDYRRLLAGSNRRSLEALVTGVAETIEPSPTAISGSRNYPSAGYAILSHGAGAEATWLALDYGPHGGGHGHPDKLGFVLYGRGQVLAPDPGTAAYGVPIQTEWFRATLAHNTLTVNENSQAPTTGACEAFAAGKDISTVTASAGKAYEGVTFRRTVGMFGTDLVLFIDQIESKDQHTYDLAYHNYGSWQPPPAGTPFAPPDKPGYKHWRDIQSVPAAEGGQLDCLVKPGLVVSCLLAAGDPTEALFGTGVGANVADRVPMVVARRHAASTTYRWGVILGGAPSTVTLSVPTVTLLTGGEAPGAAAVLAQQGARSCLMVVNPSGSLVVCNGWQGDARLFCVSTTDGRSTTAATDGGEVKRQGGVARVPADTVRGGMFCAIYSLYAPSW